MLQTKYFNKTISVNIWIQNAPKIVNYLCDNKLVSFSPVVLFFLQHKMIILKTIFQIISKFFRAARNSQFSFFIEKNEKKYEAKAVFLIS